MHRIAALVALLLSIFVAAPASAQVVITQAKALAGGVTPGDTAGYPVTLSQPGAYVLGSNLTVTPGTYGLFATANSVDIDMKGFTLSGNGGGTYGLISAFGESSLHGGVITRFRNAGIYLRNNAWTIENMKITRNGGIGIDAAGSNLITVRHSTVSYNGDHGILLKDGGFVESSTVSGNRSSGILMTASGRVVGNQVSENLIDGIVVDGGGLIQGNSVLVNSRYGISNFGRTVFVLDNSLYFNNPFGTLQINGGIDGSRNNCVGKPCFTPPL